MAFPKTIDPTELSDLLSWYQEHADLTEPLMAGQPFVISAPTDTIPVLAQNAVTNSSGGVSWVNCTMLIPLMLLGMSGGGGTGAAGPPGPQGPAGPAGAGIPTGGTTGQFLKKASDTDYDTVWET